MVERNQEEIQKEADLAEVIMSNDMAANSWLISKTIDLQDLPALIVRSNIEPNSDEQAPAS